MLAGIIFDFDGVIVDSHPVHALAWKSLFCGLGKKIEEEELSFVLEGAKREEILRHFLGELTPEEARLYGAEKERLFWAHTSELSTVHGFADFLAEAESAGLPIAVATSGSRPRVEHTLESLGLRSRFSTIVTGEDVSRGKPDPALFHLAARGLEVDAEGILVCEDAISGVVAAKAAGMKCLAIAANGRGPKLQAAGADLVVADFTKLKLDRVRGLFVQA